MERGDRTNFILKQFRKKSKRIIKKDFFTEFFYINRERRVIEFLSQDNKLVLETFFKHFLPEEFRNFVSIKLLNDIEEEINTWYYDTENLLMVIAVNWGFKKQEISIEFNVENFVVTVIDEDENIMRKVDYVLFNDYVISFLTLQARNLSEIFDKLTSKKKEKK